MNKEDLRGLLIDILNSDPATRDLPDVEGLADVVAPLLREVALTELFMAAADLGALIQNPEMPWAQGVQDAADFLRERARGIA